MAKEQFVMLRAKDFIRNNLANPKLNRNSAADEMGLSIQVVYGISPRACHSNFK